VRDLARRTAAGFTDGLVVEFAELLALCRYLVPVGQAGRIPIRAEDEAAVADGPGTGDDDRQRQRLAGQIHEAGPDVFAEQEHAEQACR
jgi:hypothetical protein